MNFYILHDGIIPDLQTRIENFDKMIEEITVVINKYNMGLIVGNADQTIKFIKNVKEIFV